MAWPPSSPAEPVPVVFISRGLTGIFGAVLVLLASLECRCVE